MPFCPECKYEYRAGIEKCPDCRKPLVESLDAPTEKQEQASDARYIEVNGARYLNEQVDLAVVYQTTGINAEILRQMLTERGILATVGSHAAMAITGATDADQAWPVLAATRDIKTRAAEIKECIALLEESEKNQR